MAWRTEAEEAGRRLPPATGFTLIELLVTVVVLAILAGLAIPRTTRAVTRARATALVSDMNSVRRASFEYFLDRNAWPPDAPPGAGPPGLGP